MNNEETDLDDTIPNTSSNTGTVEDLTVKFSQHSIEVSQQFDNKSVDEDGIELKNTSEDRFINTEANGSSTEIPIYDKVQSDDINTFSLLQKGIYQLPAHDDKSETLSALGKIHF